jgi:DNA polymerase III delta prime subunit
MRGKWKSKYNEADDKALNQFLDSVGGDADEKINDLQKENSQKEKDNNKFQ